MELLTGLPNTVAYSLKKSTKSQSRCVEDPRLLVTAQIQLTLLRPRGLLNQSFKGNSVLIFGFIAASINRRSSPSPQRRAFKRRDLLKPHKSYPLATHQ